MKDTPTPPACAIEAALDLLGPCATMLEHKGASSDATALITTRLDAARAELAVLHAEREKMRAERDRYRAALARVAHIAGGEAQIARNALARG
jgi:hypothetical protein